MSLVCPYCGKDVPEDFNFCCGEVGHAIPEDEYAAAFGERDDEYPPEDVS